MKPKIILITGASSGLGRVCAEYLASKGHKVFGTSRKVENCTNTQSLPFKVLRMDVTDLESIAETVQSIISAENRIDVLINNAGAGMAAPIEECTDRAARNLFDVNFFGVMNVCRAVLPVMREKGAGLVINISSIAGLTALPYQGIYSATKFALEAMTEALRMEVKQFGIKAVLVEPGDFPTSFTSSRSVCHVENSVYDKELKKALRAAENDENNGPDPVLVAKLIEKIILSKSPRLRYKVGRLHTVIAPLLRQTIPSSAFEKIMMSHYKIGS